MSTDDNLPSKRKTGRPSNEELRKAQYPGKRGRPKGTAAIVKEYTARMVASPKSEAVLKKIFEVALDDEHKHQAACMKMVIDRVAPMAAITSEIEQAGGKPQVNIRITGLQELKIDQSQGEPGHEGEIDGLEGDTDAIDAEFSSIDDPVVEGGAGE